MSSRIYTPTADGTCAVCRRPQGEHSRQAWDAVCLPETVTAETVTDEQIRELRRIVTPNDSLTHLWHDCCRALADGGYRYDARDHESRARCADAINARVREANDRALEHRRLHGEPSKPDIR